MVQVRDAGPLFRIKWFRVILDEASAIKNRSSDNAKAVAKLKSKRRWCLTGTASSTLLGTLSPRFLSPPHTHHVTSLFFFFFF